MTHIFLYFIPGSAGNFFSRCITLASNDIIGWLYNTGIATKLAKPKWDLTLEEKFELLSYKTSKNFNNWVEFENGLMFAEKFYPGFNIMPDDIVTLRSWHPNDLWQYPVTGRSDKSDRTVTIYIDPDTCWEWTVLNAFKKNTWFDGAWLKIGKQMLFNPEIHKVPLANIITSSDATIQEIQRIMDLLGRPLHDENKKYIKMLWDEWWATTLKKEDFQKFKEEIHFFY